MAEKITNLTVKSVVDAPEISFGPGWQKRERTTTPSISLKQTDRRALFTPSKDSPLIPLLVKLVDSAKTTVCLSSWLLQRSDLTNALLRASERGVLVFILTARNDDLEKGEGEWEIEKEKVERIKDHRQLLTDLAGKALVRTSPNFHSKFVLVDPKTDSAKGIMMTCNATVDAMSGNNVEIGVTLTTTEVKSYFSQFLVGFWKMADHELLMAGGEMPPISDKNRDVAAKRVYSTISHPCTTSESLTLREALLGRISLAKKSIIVGGWSFEKEHETIKGLIKAAESKVEVTVITRVKEHNTEALLPVMRAGGRVLGVDRFHAKFIIADDDAGLLMTSNYTSKGLDGGFESGVILERDQCLALKEIVAVYAENPDWVLKANAILSDSDSKLRRYHEDAKAFKDITIEEAPLRVDIGSIQLPLSKIREYRIDVEKERGKIKDQRVQDKVHKKMELVKTVIPQSINVGELKAMELPGKSVGLYEHKKTKKRYIDVTTWEEYDSAELRELAKEKEAELVLVRK